FPVKRETAAALFRSILDVIVNQERVVVELEYRGGRERRFEHAPEPSTGCHTQRWAQRFGFTQRVVEHEIVELLAVTGARWDPTLDLRLHQFAAFAQVFEEDSIVHCRSTWRTAPGPAQRLPHCLRDSPNDVIRS